MCELMRTPGFANRGSLVSQTQLFMFGNDDWNPNMSLGESSITLKENNHGKEGKVFLYLYGVVKCRTKCCIIFYPLGTHFSIAQMTLQRHIIIIVRDAKFEPGTTVSAIWWASNDPQKKSLILNLNYEQKQIEHCKQNLYYDVQRKTIYLALLIIYLNKLF